jgi:hypothetical protein
MSFRFHVIEEPWVNRTKLLLIESDGQVAHSIARDQGGRLIRTKLSEMEAGEPDPFMTLDSDFARLVFPALIEALSKKGFERPSESKLAGLHEAQSAHLKDLQTMIAALVINRKRP